MDTSSLPDLDTPARRQQLVSQFMDRLANDALLCPVFGNSMTADRPVSSPAEQQAWWDAALAGECYQGRPLRATHVHPYTGPLYERWCQLLKNTFDRNFEGPEATAAQGHVLNLATMLSHWRLAQQDDYTTPDTNVPKELAAA
jgi:truncated hemoglobin YjbI